MVAPVIPPARHGGRNGLTRWAEATARRGEHGASLAAARDGLKMQDETAYGCWAAELHRFEGIALLGLNRLDEGQRALETALRVARSQQAKAFELTRRYEHGAALARSGQAK
jgi:hypothetical protein